MHSMTKFTLCTLLGGCGTVQVVPIRPPAALLQPCRTVPTLATNNEQLATLALDLKHALAECSAEKQSLLNWANQEK